MTTQRHRSVAPQTLLLSLACGLLLGCAGSPPARPASQAPAAQTLAAQTPAALTPGCPLEEAPARELAASTLEREGPTTLTGGFRGIATTVRPTIRR